MTGNLWSLEAEQAVLSALLQFDCMDDVVGAGLNRRDFYNEPHKHIFDAIERSHESGSGTDVISISNTLKSLNLLEKTGGSAYLSELSDAVATDKYISHHAKIIKEKSILRQLVTCTEKIRAMATDGADDAAGLLNDAESMIMGIRDVRDRGGLLPVSDWGDTFRQLDDRITGNKLSGVPFGFMDWDNLSGGAYEGNLIILAGRTGMGKTAMALEIALRSVMPSRRDHGGFGRDPFGVAFFSLEMPREEVKQRLLSMVSNVGLTNIQTGRGIDQEDRRRMLEAADKITKTPLYLEATGETTVQELRAKSRRFKRDMDKHGVPIGWVIIDYLQYVVGKGDTREQEVAAVSRGLKNLGNELGCPVLALAQLNRKVEDRSVKKPVLSDLRESGALEQDAHQVAFVYREEQYEKTQTNAGKAELLVRKNRQGPTKDISLTYAGSRVSFFSASKEG